MIVYSRFFAEFSSTFLYPTKVAGKKAYRDDKKINIFKIICRIDKKIRTSSDNLYHIQVIWIQVVECNTDG
jgi:hypothetical protein